MQDELNKQIQERTSFDGGRKLLESQLLQMEDKIHKLESAKVCILYAFFSFVLLRKGGKFLRCVCLAYWPTDLLSKLFFMHMINNDQWMTFLWNHLPSIDGESF